MVYYILLVCIYTFGGLCFCHTGKVNFKKNKKLFLVLSYTLMVIILGMRNKTVGVDTKNYYLIFSMVAETPFSEIIKSYYFLSIEVGYVMLMKILSIFGNYYLFQITVAIITCILFADFFSNNMENYFIAVILFLGFDIYLLSFNISRQMLAVALIINCWSCLNKNKKIEAAVLFLIAELVHTTSWLFIVIYLVYIMRKNKLIIRLLPIVWMLIIAAYKIILNKIASIVPHYANYYGNHKTVLEVGLSKIIWMLVLTISILLIFRNIIISGVKAKSSNNIEKRNKFSENLETYLYATFSLCYVGANIVGLSFNYFERLGCYFAPFVIITFERFGMQIKSTAIRRLYYCGLVVCFSIYFILSTRTEQYAYSFFFVLDREI